MGQNLRGAGAVLGVGLRQVQLRAVHRDKTAKVYNGEPSVGQRCTETASVAAQKAN